jgi:hypothetical protein
LLFPPLRFRSACEDFADQRSLGFIDSRNFENLFNNPTKSQDLTRKTLRKVYSWLLG